MPFTFKYMLNNILFLSTPVNIAYIPHKKLT